MESAADIVKKCQSVIGKMQIYPGVGKTTREELASLTEKLTPIALELEEIEGRYDWSLGGEREDQIRQSYATWRTKAPGVAVDISQHAKNSPLLKAFYQKGVDFDRSRVFTADEEKFSALIGKNFDLVHDIISDINKARDLGTGKFSALVRQRKSLFHSLELFKGAIDPIQVQIKTKEGRWIPAKSEWMRDTDQMTRIMFRKSSPALHALLLGHWMTCYVKNIIKDHLERNDKVFEIYANVSYRAPSDLIRSSSDFDVIGMSGNSIFCVECKSGRIDEKRNDVATIGDRIADIRTVLEAFADSSQNIDFSLVYNPHVNTNPDIFRHLRDMDVTVLKPSDVRTTVAQLTR